MNENTKMTHTYTLKSRSEFYFWQTFYFKTTEDSRVAVGNNIESWYCFPNFLNGSMLICF